MPGRLLLLYPVAPGNTADTCAPSAMPRPGYSRPPRRPFFNGSWKMVILERVREDIHETKKLNVHLFNSLKKALYKPGGFFKGMLIYRLPDMLRKRGNPTNH